MADTYPRKLQLWEGWVPAVARSDAVASGETTRPPSITKARADRLFCTEAFQGLGHGAEDVEPFSLQWFLHMERRRHRRYGWWIPQLLEFSKHAGETMLGLGSTLGTDWVQYARHGAEVVVCSSSAEHLSLARSNFELRGLNGTFLHSGLSALPLEAASIDVVCLDALRSEEPLASVVEEIYRVLKPGGKVVAVVPARYNVDYWCRWLPFRGWTTLTSLPGQPTTERTSAKALRRCFERFAEHRIYKRHLRRAEVPHLFRWLPLGILERILGRVLILKAFKPVSAAIGNSVAA
jgi:SAM-dependent methyltransferase